MKNLAPPPRGRLLVKRDGHSITRVIPKHQSSHPQLFSTARRFTSLDLNAPPVPG